MNKLFDVLNDLKAARLVCVEDGVVNLALTKAYAEIINLRKKLNILENENQSLYDIIESMSDYLTVEQIDTELTKRNINISKAFQRVVTTLKKVKDE